ncbi:MAG: phosphotransferase [Lachnospiraceae bacterium]|nr:phosphotransferase [Lachnospiraceae bacterium]
MEKILEKVKCLYEMKDYSFEPVQGHEGGRNLIYICKGTSGDRRILRISATGDRNLNDYLAETEFVHYLAENGAPAADVISSVNGLLVEQIDDGEECIYISLFEYAKGMLLVDNGYRYRDGAPLEEYFFNTGKTLGAIHRLSKQYKPVHRRPSYFDKYNMDYIDSLIPDSFAGLKNAISARIEEFRRLPSDESCFGLVHFDFSDGNYHIDMNTGDITVFDFDNCMYCWYMFDLANLWTHGEGWCRFEEDPEKRKAFMNHYFDTILDGYRSETDISQEMVDRLPLFIDMVLIENVVDEFECCAREGEDVDPEDIEDVAECLIGGTLRL